MELINLPSLLNDTQLVSLLKDLPCHFVTSTVVYNLQQSTSSSIFSFKSFLSNTYVDQLLRDPSSMYICGNLSFKDSHNGSIVAGDLRIIKDNKLKYIFSRGPKYCEPTKIDFDQARKNIINSVESCISIWSQKHGITSVF